MACPIVFNDLSKQELFCLSDNTSKKRIVLFFFSKLASKLSILIWISLRKHYSFIAFSHVMYKSESGSISERMFPLLQREMLTFIWKKKCLGRQAGNSRWRRLCHMDSKFPLSSY